MNYEKVIVELLSRIQILEEKVDLVMSNQAQVIMVKAHIEIIANVVKVKTKDIREYIEAQKEEARSRGEEFIVLRASNIHRINKLKNSMPMVCNAMRQCMGDNDIVLHETPSGYSSSLEIRYML